MLGPLLFRAIPQRDVKPLARKLTAHVGGFNGTTPAAPARLSGFHRQRL